MDFCGKCGSVMVAKKQGAKTILVCRKCGSKMEDYKPMEIEEDIENRHELLRRFGYKR